METFRIRAVPGEDTCTLILSGEADLAVADDIIELGTLSLNETATHTLIVDLASITFIESTALGALIRLRNFATGQGKTMSLVNIPDSVARVLHIAGLDKIFATDVAGTRPLSDPPNR